jgi:hypothetical protein
MPNPVVIVEMVSFWPLAVGIFALIFRRRVQALLSRTSARLANSAGRRALSLAIVFSALFLIDMGLGGTVWSLSPSAARPAIAVIVMTIAVPLGLLLLRYARVQQP